MGHFKKGDYIVLVGRPINSNNLLSKSTGGGTFLLNYIFKIRESSSIIVVEKDCKGSISNGWSCYNYEFDNWRFADFTERARYDEFNEPCITNNKISIDNYSII